MTEINQDQNLDSYYLEKIETWKHGGKNGGPGGWAGLYYGIFSSIIKENGFKHCAEIGIGYGLHAKEILENTNVEQLYLIDPMQYYGTDDFSTYIVNNGGFDNLVRNIQIHLQEFSDRYTWFRQPSLSIQADQIADESLDAIFIDGDHSYLAVSQDLPFWWKKLRKGGWLLGDDYGYIMETRMAVDEFAKVNGLSFELVTKPHVQYPIYKFIKK